MSTKMINDYRFLLSVAFSSIGLFGLAGCDATYPEGKYTCADDDSCPKGMLCDKNRGNTCWKTLQSTDKEEGDRTNGSSDPATGAGDYAGEQGNGSGQGGRVDTGDERGEAGESRGTGENGGSGGGTAGREAGIGGTDPKPGNDGVGGTYRASGGGRGDNAAGSGNGGKGGNDVIVTDYTVTDPVTHLIWQRCAAGQSGASCEEGSAQAAASWQSALNSCETLTLANSTEWRLPNVHELFTITDYMNIGSHYSATYFPASPQGPDFWTSTEMFREPTYAWTIGGLANPGYMLKSENYGYARCVQGEELLAQLSRCGKSTEEPVICDATTSLMWQGCTGGRRGEVCGSGTALTFSARPDAETYCEQLTYGGYGDWKLPNIRDLVSIVDFSTYNPAINREMFPDTPRDGSYWSSTLFAAPDYVGTWYVSFWDGWAISSNYQGVEIPLAITTPTYVRCVRGGPWSTIGDRSRQ